MAPEVTLTEDQRTEVIERIEGDVTAVCRAPLTEDARCIIIKLFTMHAIDEVTTPVRPSKLPDPTTRVRRKMTQMRRSLGQKDYSPEVKELVLERYYHGLLLELADIERLGLDPNV